MNARRTVPEVLILSEKNAQLYEPSRREVCISVTGPGKPLPNLSAQFLRVLRLAFSDITEPIDDPDYVLFNAQHAEEIIGFVRQHERDVDRIVIHCQAGFSRSPGIAVGLCAVFGWDSPAELQQKHPLCNNWVRDELIRAGRARQES
jgi:predicted protein tyrosine phosphatase